MRTAPDLSKGTLRHPEEARQFVEATGVNILAPAVGNMHGMLQKHGEGRDEKALGHKENRPRSRRATGVFLTLHGGSGTDDEDFREAIAAGINIIHINTELRVAWRRGLEDGLAKQKDEVVPYRILSSVVAAVKQVAESRLRLFSRTEQLAGRT